MKALCKEPNNEEKYGISIIPTHPNKVPYKGWKQYQSEVAPLSNWYSHYINQGYVGIITGKVSGNLEVIDIDTKNDPDNTIYQEYIKLIPEELLNRLIIQQTPSGGYHFIYRCPDVSIESSQKLALHDDKKVIIETRGERGYICSHSIDYKITQGVFDIINHKYDIPILSSEERAFLLETARSLTRYFPKPSKNDKSFSYTEPAINDFNYKYDAIEVFANHGWSIVNDDDEKYYLLRDGSVAAHSGYYFKETKTFFCFSTSTEFKAGKPYNNFQILQVLKGKNDYKSTIRLLANYGYETSTKSSKITPDDIADYLNSNEVRFDEFTQDLIYKDKVIEERDYNTLFIDMNKHFDKLVPQARFDNVIKSRYIQSVNPIEDFINAHKDSKPTGTFEKWFDCIELKDKSIERSIALKYIMKWYVGMVAQALNGRFPNDLFLTFLSVEQGIGKTTLLREYTLPKELQKYVVEHALDFDDDFMVLMGQSLLIIDDEMDGKTWNTMNTFKSVLSSQNRSLRRKYDRRMTTIHRRCSFAGSGNQLTVVKESRNRRIIPLEIGSIDFKKLDGVDLVDLFIEAFHLFESGFNYSYQRGEDDEMRHLYEAYVQKSDLEDAIDTIVQKPTNENVWLITNWDILICLQQKYPSLGKKINSPSIGKLMQEKGFKSVRKKSSGQKFTCYEIALNSKVVDSQTLNSQSFNLNDSENPLVAVKKEKIEFKSNFDFPY